MTRYTELKGAALFYLFFLWSLWFINIGVRVIFAPILPVIEDEFLVTHATASSIFIFQSLGYASSMLFSGFFAGRFGYKKSIALSLAIICALCFVMPWVRLFWLLYVFSVILGLAIGIYLPSVLPLITEYFAERYWGKCIAIHDSGASVSIFAMPFVVLFFLHFLDWRGMFQVIALFILAALVIFWRSTDEVKIRRSERSAFGVLIKNRSLWILEILFTFAAGANLGVYAVVPLYLTKELSLSIQSANSLLGISRMVAIPVALVVPFFIDRINLLKAMFAALMISGVFTILMGIGSVTFVGIFLCLQTIVVTGFFPVGIVVMATMFSREERSMATGLILALSIVLGGGVMPYLLGLSGDLISFRYGMIIMGIMACLSSLLTFRLKGAR